MKATSLFIGFFLWLVCYNANAQWIQQNSGTSDLIYDIACINEDTCYAVGDWGYIRKTIDGGNNWISFNNGADTMGYYLSIYCLNSDICLTSKIGGGIYKTVNGGNSWYSTIVPATGGISPIFMVNDSVGYAGEIGVGEYLKTTDGGETWILGNTLAIGWNYSTYFIDDSIGFFGSQMGEISKTVDGGNNWSTFLTGLMGILSMNFPTDSIGFAGALGTILKTYDQGATWDTLNIGISTGIISSIECIDKDTCYAVSDSGVIIKTTDGGNNWSLDTVGVPLLSLKSIVFPSVNVGYVVGNDGLIIKKDKTNSICCDPIIWPFSIFPNPFSKELNIYNDDYRAVIFEIYDLLGKKQLSVPLNTGSNKINRGSLASGMYIYIIRGKNNYGWEVIKRTGKLIVK